VERVVIVVEAEEVEVEEVEVEVEEVEVEEVEVEVGVREWIKKTVVCPVWMSKEEVGCVPLPLERLRTRLCIEPRLPDYPPACLALDHMRTRLSVLTPAFGQRRF